MGYVNKTQLQSIMSDAATKVKAAIAEGGGGSIDTAMSDSSTNAVQNKVIKSYVDSQISSAITGVLNTEF